MSPRTAELFPSNPARTAPRWRPSIPFVIIAAVFVSLCGVAIFAAADNGRSHVVDKCQSHISARLVAPSTTRFENVRTLGNPAVAVNGTVHASNGFGVPIAHDFQCSVEGTAVTLEWLR